MRVPILKAVSAPAKVVLGAFFACSSSFGNTISFYVLSVWGCEYESYCLYAVNRCGSFVSDCIRS